MTKKTTYRQTAIALRTEEKLTLKDISVRIPVSKATLSVWLRDYPLPEEEKEKFKQARVGRRMSTTADSLSFPQRERIRTTLAGSISETAVLLALLKLGYKNICKPVTENCRYDFVLDADDALLRLQVKTARTDGRVLIFNTRSINPYNRKGSSYKGQIDWFAAYSPDTGKVYMVHVDAAPDAVCRLRLVPSHLATGNYASDFELSESWDPRFKPEKTAAAENPDATLDPVVEAESFHGTLNGYTHHKCRCDLCKAKWRDYCRVQKAEWRANRKNQ